MKYEIPLLEKIVSAVTGNKTKNDPDVAFAKKSLKGICSAIDKFAQKADGRLAEKFPELSLKIKDLSRKMHMLEPDVSTAAGKAEQAIAQKITCASSSCEVVLTGGGAEELEKQLAELEKLVHIRSHGSLPPPAKQTANQAALF
ncbi:hypothetical protein HRI96_11205 [Treponema parvum]|uniref:Uncharacterized protein n=1 Tax=Treponema parvum TaxID=138851 RepID=A0A975F1M8_9SPIR|nr:hypothetical protein [Treponema parvum]QTQ12713.1 hypothetical protein HRI96_11205 [Treponema parvum]